LDREETEEDRQKRNETEEEKSTGWYWLEENKEIGV